MVNKGNHPQMALIQVSEILYFTQNIRYDLGIENANNVGYHDIMISLNIQDPNISNTSHFLLKKTIKSL